MITCLYVDEMLIFGTDLAEVEKTESFLSSKFSMKDMGKANVILDIKIIRDNDVIFLTQSHYIEKVLLEVQIPGLLPDGLSFRSNL